MTSSSSTPNTSPLPKQTTAIPIRVPDSNFDNYPMSPPDYTSDGGMTFSLSSLLHHRSSHEHLLSPASSEASTHSEDPLGNSVYINKLLSIEPYYSNRIKKGFSMSTIPESPSLVSQVKEQGISAGSTSDLLTMKHMPDFQPPQSIQNASSPPPSLTRAASAGHLCISDQKQTLALPGESIAAKNNKFRTGNSSPNVTHRDLNQFAPLHF